MDKETKTIIDRIRSKKTSSSTKVHLLSSVANKFSDNKKLSIYFNLKDIDLNWAVKSSLFNLIIKNKNFCICNDLITEVELNQFWVNRLVAAKSLNKHKCGQEYDRIHFQNRLLKVLKNEPYPEVRKLIILIFKNFIINGKILNDLKNFTLINISNYFESFFQKNNNLKKHEEFNMHHDVYLFFDEFNALCDLFLEKDETTFLIKIIEDVISSINNINQNNLENYLHEILDSSLISIMLKTKSGNKVFLKKISSNKLVKKNIRNICIWRIKLFNKNQQTEIFIGNKNIIDNETDYNLMIPIDDFVDFKYCEKAKHIFEDFNIIDSNVRNKLDNINPSFKIQAIEQLWGLNISDYSFVSGATGTLKIHCDNTNKAYYLKNIGNSHQSAVFVCHFVSWLVKFNSFKVSTMIKTKNGKLCAKINEFYYSLEQEIMTDSDFSVDNIDYKSFHSLGLECGLFHKITKNYSPIAFKSERPISDPIQFEELIYFFEYIIDIDDHSLSRAKVHKDKSQLLNKIGLSNLKKINLNDPDPYIRLMIENYDLIDNEYNSLINNFNWTHYSSLERKYIHFDFSWNNLVWSNEKIIQMYDWNKSGRMPFAEEVKNSVMNHGLGRKFDPLAIINFLNGYLINSSFNEHDVYSIMYTLKSTYIAAFHDHLSIFKSNNINGLFFKRMCYNSIMFESFCGFFDEYLKILTNQFRKQFESDVHVLTTKPEYEKDIKYKLINYMLFNIDNENYKNSLRYIAALRQICDLDNQRYICNKLEKILIDQTDLKDVIKNEIIKCFYSIGSENTFLFLNEILFNKKFKNQRYYILNCMKFIVVRNKNSRIYFQNEISKFSSYFFENSDTDVDLGFAKILSAIKS